MRNDIKKKESQNKEMKERRRSKVLEKEEEK